MNENFYLLESAIMNGTVRCDSVFTIIKAENFEIAKEKVKNMKGVKEKGINIKEDENELTGEIKQEDNKILVNENDEDFDKIQIAIEQLNQIKFTVYFSLKNKIIEII